MAKRSDINPRHTRFVAEYLIDGNGSRSALAAGYALSHCKQTARELLLLPEIQNAIAAGQKRITAKLELTAEKVLGDIERIANKAEKEKRYGEAIRGKHLLGQHLKLFTEKHEHGGIGGGPILFAITEKEADL